MQEQENYTQAELFRFDPITVVRSVLKRWYIIVMAALLLGTAAYVYRDFGYQPSYTSRATFVASVRSSTGTVYQNLTATSNLASVFTEVLNSSILKATVLEELGMTSFNGTIQATVVPDTNLLTLQVTDSDARTAYLVTRSSIDNHSVVTQQVLGDTILEVLQEPRIPTGPSNYRDSRDFAKKAAILAAAAACGLLVLLSVARDSVRSRREAEEKLECRQRGCKGNKSDCIGNRDFKGEYLGRFGGVDLANGKRGTSAYRVADTGERGKACQEKKQWRGINGKEVYSCRRKEARFYLWRQ